jgi:hypothetical protein
MARRSMMYAGYDSARKLFCALSLKISCHTAWMSSLDLLCLRSKPDASLVLSMTCLRCMCDSAFWASVSS